MVFVMSFGVLNCQCQFILESDKLCVKIELVFQFNTLTTPRGSKQKLVRV